MMILIDRGEGGIPRISVEYHFGKNVSRTRKPPAPPDAALDFGQKSSCILPAPWVSERASARTSSIAAGTARARRTRHSRSALGRHVKNAELRAQRLAFALGTPRLV